MERKAVLVTGAAGNVGARLVRRLVSLGKPVRGLVLPDDPHASRLDGVDCELVRGDITRPETLSGVLDGVDTVFHLAAVVLADDPRQFERVNVGGTRNLVDAAEAAAVRHLVHVSSASVIYPHSTPYSRSKRRGEAAVRRRLPHRFTIVRPTLVYEAGGGEEFLIFVDFLRRLPFVPLVGDGRALKNPVFCEDLIDGLVALVDNPKALSKTYALCGGEEVSLRELASLILAAQGVRKPFVPIPLPICRMVARLAGVLSGRLPFAQHTIAGLSQDANLDLESARRDLGYNPIGVREGIARCFISSPK